MSFTWNFKEMFPGHVCLLCDIGWPPRSPYFTPCDFFSGLPQARVYQQRPQSLETLMEEAIYPIIPLEIIRNVIETTESQCIHNEGRHLSNVFFTLFKNKIKLAYLVWFSFY